MLPKKQNVFKSPDTSKMREVIIDGKTRIYVPMNVDPEQARNHFKEKLLLKESAVDSKRHKVSVED